MHARLTFSSQNVFKMPRQAKLHVDIPSLISHVLSIQEYPSIQCLLLPWRVHSRFFFSMFWGKYLLIYINVSVPVPTIPCNLCFTCFVDIL